MLHAHCELKELEPPAERLRKFRRVQNETFSRGLRDFNSQSPVLSIFTRVPIKAGRSWFCEEDGAVTDPSFLAEVKHETELPRWLSIDPVGFEYRRFLWRAETREERK